jgi:hypothetical protein
MTNRPNIFFILILCILCFSSCKFFFNESEYLGSYPGYIESEIPALKTCDGQVILTDVGDNVVNIELISDSNATMYFNNLKVERGYFLNSADLRIDATNIRIWISRTNHDMTFRHDDGSTYDWSFYGTRQ